MFKKKNEAFASVKEVVLSNTGLTQDELFHPVEEPYIHNLAKGVDFFKSYMSTHKDAAVYVVGDYDSDGINATVIMVDALRYYGIKDIRYRIPKRFSEGYGLSENLIKEIEYCLTDLISEETGDAIIITVDNGITAYNAIQMAKDKGFAVIVTDHHLPPVDEDGNRILPPADVVIDPAAEDESEYRDYCGAGIAYRFAKQLHNGAKMTQLLAQASLATVTDVMKVTGANRVLLQNGLSAMSQRRILPGMAAILDRMNIDEHISEQDYGFKLGPVFNASSRMADDGAKNVIKVLLTVKDPALPYRVKCLVETNEERKKVSAEQLGIAEEKLNGEKPIVVYDPRFDEGIIGIIAGRLAEKYHCPAIVLTKTGNGVLKGSARTIPEIHIKNALDKCKDLLLGYGGHAGAAGLSLEEDSLNAFVQKFSEACGEIPAVSDDVLFDLEITAEQVPFVMNDLKKYGPYGNGNPAPVFKMTLPVKNYILCSGNTSFIADNGDNIKIMGFGLVKEYEALGKPKTIDAVGTLSESWYNGEMKYSFEVKSFKEART